MSMPVKLSARQQQVLGATIRHYIATARPVGSEALVDGFNPKVSPATIRNAMGYLEKSGLLYQPHISAGRVPSDSGYRIYVDQIVTPSDSVARQVGQILSDQLHWKDLGIEALLREAAQILSAISGYIALITVPQTSQAQLRHLQLVPLDPTRAMLVVVLDTYETQSILMPLPLQSAERETPDAERLDRELQILSNFLTSQLRGHSLSEIATLDWGKLGHEFERYGELLRHSVGELHRRSQLSVSTQILINGVAELLRRHPEFSEVQQVQTIIQLLESEPDQLWSLIFDADPALPSQDLSGSRVTVRIGAENPLEPFRSCALVSATYQRGSVPVGSVGMLGPTRMVYENAIAIVEAAANYLSQTLSQEKG